MSLVHALPEPVLQQHRENVVRLKVPAGKRRDEVMGWAIEQVAEAERRVAALQERIAYLESLSITDELTGLLNRRGFLWELQRTLATAKRAGPAGTLILCDLDGFKSVNDCWGHAAGDEVLRRVASALSARTRRSDVVARIGGDEFAIVLVGAGLTAARRKSQILAGKIVEAAAGAVVNERVSIGVSFGFAAFVGEEAEDDLLGQADLAMYGAKRRKYAGRAAAE
jgi:diguanylate cyclase (GGDEF)-like protein